MLFASPSHTQKATHWLGFRLNEFFMKFPKLLLQQIGMKVGSSESLESKELFIHTSPTELSFFQALFNFVHYFFFKNIKSMRKSINHNRWKILKHFNSKVDKTSPIIIVCCVLQNYYEMWDALKLRLTKCKNKR
jgi:hypothetical protein